MQTALQELIEKIETQREDGNTDLRTTLFHARRLLEVEKQQVVNAWREGYSECENYQQDRQSNADKYFTETYPQ
jgi:hypothetical protein